MLRYLALCLLVPLLYTGKPISLLPRREFVNFLTYNTYVCDLAISTCVNVAIVVVVVFVVKT